MGIGSDLALGETASTAYAGNKGKANADEIAKIKNGSTVVPKATDAATVSGHTVHKMYRKMQSLQILSILLNTQRLLILMKLSQLYLGK